MTRSTITVKSLIAVIEGRSLTGKPNDLEGLANQIVENFGTNKCVFPRVRSMLQRMVTKGELVNSHGMWHVTTTEERRQILARQGRRVAGIRKKHARGTRRRPSGHNMALIGSLLTSCSPSMGQDPQTDDVHEGPIPTAYVGYAPQSPSRRGGWEEFADNTPPWEPALFDAVFPPLGGQMVIIA